MDHIEAPHIVNFKVHKSKIHKSKIHKLKVCTLHPPHIFMILKYVDQKYVPTFHKYGTVKERGWQPNKQASKPSYRQTIILAGHQDSGLAHQSFFGTVSLSAWQRHRPVSVGLVGGSVVWGCSRVKQRRGINMTAFQIIIIRWNGCGTVYFVERFCGTVYFVERFCGTVYFVERFCGTVYFVERFTKLLTDC